MLFNNSDKSVEKGNEDSAGNFEIRDDRPTSRKAGLVEIDRSSRERKLTLDSKIASLLYIDRFIDASHMIHCTCPARKEGPCVKSIQCQSDTTRGLVLPPTALSILGCLLGITSILGNHPFTHPCMCTADVLLCPPTQDRSDKPTIHCRLDLPRPMPRRRESRDLNGSQSWFLVWRW